MFWNMIRGHHVVFSIFFANEDAQVALTLTQRVKVLACLVFTSLCVTAMLLGHRSSDVVSRVIAGVVAAGCMLPCRMLLPRLYKSANAPLPDRAGLGGKLRGWLRGRGGAALAAGSKGPRAPAPPPAVSVADRVALASKAPGQVRGPTASVTSNLVRA